MDNFLFIDSPMFYPAGVKFFTQGSSPKILSEFVDFLYSRAHVIDTVYLCLYLYNNEILHNALLNLSKKGIPVHVISIPLEGYDSAKPRDLYDANQPLSPALKSQTKYDLAEKLYRGVKNSPVDYFTLHIFPHMYIRSPRVRPFSRGRMPYSLHGKSFYIKYKTGGGAMGLTSSNLAARDLVKDELMVVSENDPASNIAAQAFFNALISNAIPIDDFDDGKGYYDYPIKRCQIAVPKSNTLYIAPFYQNAQAKAEMFLQNLIKGARERVLLCAQHICAPGILGAILEKSKDGVAVRCLSQTFVDGAGRSHGCRRPENTGAFGDFIREYEKYDHCAYAANESVHSKFIIVDDTAVVTTCNLTPTQFIYRENVNISRFDNMPGLAYRGIHSEVGQFLVVKDQRICKALEENFDSIWCRPATYHHKKQTVKNSGNVKICRLCGGSMAQRNGRFGPFWGCVSFPKCKHTEN